MQHTPNINEELSKSRASAPVVGAGAASDAMSPTQELSALLNRAGALAASLGLDLDAWMKTAWSAYVDAKPGLREHLEDMQLIAQLTAMRQSGRIGQA